jgi:hypothetical protein
MIQGSSPGKRGKKFYSKTFRPVLRSAQPPIKSVPGLKWPAREVDYSFKYTAEVKNSGAKPLLFLRLLWS